ncbi:unnamed protein product, partial [Brassica rapa]
KNPFRNPDHTQINTITTTLNERNHSTPPTPRFSGAPKQ